MRDLAQPVDESRTRSPDLGKVVTLRSCGNLQRRFVMKRLYPLVVYVFLMLLGTSSYADPSAEKMLNAIVKIKATVPKEAFTQVHWVRNGKGMECLLTRRAIFLR